MASSERFRIPSNRSEQHQFTDRPEWFHAFLGSTDQKTVQGTTLLKGLEEKTPALWEKIKDPQCPLEILLVGPGVGTTEIDFLKFLQETRGLENVSAYYEDPSLPMGVEFAKLAQDAEVDSVIKRFDVRRFEEPQYVPPDVDIALGFQVWHYIDGWHKRPPVVNSLFKFASTVQRKDGVGVISVQARKSENFGIRQRYIPQIHAYDEIAAEDIGDELERLQIPHSLDVVSSTLNIASLFEYQDFEPNHMGKNLLSFIFRVDWDTLDTGLKAGIGVALKTLVENKRKAQMNLADGYIWIPASPIT